ncbi:MAG: DUF1566 domain-containing protein, partial [Bdellovibrionaceae bacterium]|nr:DUF1566 domain-containing protein [Pseudobdellovibrionaceae bacterium]
TLSIPMADQTGVSAGLISKAQYDAFNGKMDVPAGTDGHFLKRVSGVWTSSLIDIGDIKNSAGNSTFDFSACGAGKTVKWQSVPDRVTCEDISITKSQVSDLGTIGSIAAKNSIDLTSDVSGVLPIAHGGTGTNDGSITGSGALTFAAGGGNQNITLTPSGTGSTLLNGKVGIGTTTPFRQLTLHESADASSAIQLSVTGATANQSANINFITKGTGNDNFDATTKGWEFVGRGDAYGTAEQRNDLLMSHWNGSSWGIAMALDSLTLNVGVGTTTPAGALHVARQVSGLSLPVRMQNLDAVNGSSTGMAFKVASTSGDTNYKSGIVFNRTSNGGIGNLHFLMSSLTDGSNVALTDSRMTLTNTGRLGIGRTDPQSTLDVAGTIRAEQICDETGNNCHDISTGWSGGGGGAGWTLQTISSSQTLTSADAGKMFIVTAAATLTLPDVGTVPSGFRFAVKRTGSGAANVILDGHSTQKIDGFETKTLKSQYDSVTLVSNGTQWLVEAGYSLGSVDPCYQHGSPAGTACEGGSIYAGSAYGYRYMIMPSGCTNSTTNPTCNGDGSENISKTWNNGTTNYAFLTGVDDIVTGMMEGPASSALIAAVTAPAQGGQHQAARYCEDMVFGGYSDWYLPTAAESYIFVCNVYGVAAATLCGYLGVTASMGLAGHLPTTASYWVASQTSADNSQAVYIDLGNMTVTEALKNSSKNVRCVRRY